MMVVDDAFWSRLGRRAYFAVKLLLPCGMLLTPVSGGLAANATTNATADATTDAMAEKKTSDSQTDKEPRFAVHGQTTYTFQVTNDFKSPYLGPESLTPKTNDETVDATLFLGARLWRGAETWVNPEVDQGFGLDNTLGVAGFTSGEAYKVGANHPYYRTPRWFIRQTIDTGGAQESVDGEANQFAGSQTHDRWLITVGKISVPDIFDSNPYAHDPRNDFLNWSAVGAGTFDYAADSWGYTIGVAVERYIGSWVYRAGAYDLSNTPNSEVLEHGLHEFQYVAEIERDYQLFGHTGSVLVTAYDNRARMGLLDQAIALAEATGTTPSAANVRTYRGRLGASLNLQQPITDDLGVFARVGKAQGNVEAYDFTDIDRSIEVGASLQGQRWHRPNDTLGVAFMNNDISGKREEYFALGGMGILCGDGELPHPGAEQIVESYYKVSVVSWAQVTLDYQRVNNPCYNTDRGPVSVGGVRVHAFF
jgi:high affinity Mn2+ porin